MLTHNVAINYMPHYPHYGMGGEIGGEMPLFSFFESLPIPYNPPPPPLPEMGVVQVGHTITIIELS